jgi:hypothetical protein
MKISELKTLIKESIKSILQEEDSKDDWKKVASFKIDGTEFNVKDLEDMGSYYRVFTTNGKTYNSKILDERGAVKTYKVRKPSTGGGRPKSPNMTKTEYKKLCKETISGHEYSDHSTIYDLAENAIRSNRELSDYVRRLIYADIGYYFQDPRNNTTITRQDIIEKFTNELEMYTK